jgi:1-aminocyclopropane-1-carboxylate deaminase
VQINANIAEIQTLKLGKDHKVQIDILRLDQIHPVISGNKWYKLRYYIEDAIEYGFTEIASFGGAYSNHIVATACACYENNLKSIGFIRGDQCYSSFTYPPNRSQLWYAITIYQERRLPR